MGEKEAPSEISISGFNAVTSVPLGTSAVIVCVVSSIIVEKSSAKAGFSDAEKLKPVICFSLLSVGAVVPSSSLLHAIMKQVAIKNGTIFNVFIVKDSYLIVAIASEYSSPQFNPGSLYIVVPWVVSKAHISEGMAVRRLFCKYRNLKL